MNVMNEHEQQQQYVYTVEYQDLYGITYYEEVIASSTGAARGLVQSRRPDVHIRAVTMNPINEEQLERTAE